MASNRYLGRRGFLQGAMAATLGLQAQAARARENKYTERADPLSPKTGHLIKEKKPIRIGIIGVGGKGMDHLGQLLEREKNGVSVQVLGVSDVYIRRQERAKARVKDVVRRKIDAYTDYRKLLERDDVDAVVIATPDHWHALTSIHAIEAGKDVYCEKPVTLTIEESLDVRDAVYRTGRIFQCGVQGTSSDLVWQARDFIKKGGIGKVLWAQADASRNSKGGPGDRGGEWNWHIDPDSTDDPKGGEAYVDWTQWLGSAPKRPFSQPRFFQFRKYWDYSGGIATDLHYHVLAPLTLALDAHAPERATGSGGIFIQKDDREVPDTFMMSLDYPDDFSIVLTSSMANEQGNPVIIRGHCGTIYFTKDKKLRIAAEPQFVEWFKKEHGAEELIFEPRPRLDHMDKWLECIRTRGPVHLDAETAYRAMCGIKMGVDSYRQDKVIFWDGERECYADSHPRPNRDSKVPALSS